MGSATAWQQLVVAVFWPRVVHEAVSASQLKAHFMSALSRLKRRPEFLKVAATRCMWVAPGLIVQARKRNVEEADTQDARVGFTVSRKVGNSVKRNRVRRRLKAAATIIMIKHAQEGTDFVIIGRKNTLKRPFEALKSDLTVALKKLETNREGI
jgi:ribonuclease P protein component